MGGFFAIVSKEDCVSDLFYGTDYHSHLGTKRGGLAVRNSDALKRYIHDITNDRSDFFQVLDSNFTLFFKYFMDIILTHHC